VIQKKQKCRACHGAWNVWALLWCWLPVVLLALAVSFAMPANPNVALGAETTAASDDKGDDSADEQTEEKEAKDGDEKSEEKAVEKLPESTDKKPATADEKADEKAADRKDESAPEEAKKMKAPASPLAQQASPEGETTPAVEADPEIEVEPPKDDAENGSKKPLPPKQQPEPTKKKKCVIGATATLLEKQSELLFHARVDSGAKSCSLHIEKMEIEGEAEKMVDNIGKVIRFQVKNGDKKTHWLESKIAGYVIIKTSDHKERRYKVPLTFRWKNLEKEVLVTLNNRSQMEYPLLLGRNYLRGDFLIDVELNSDD